MALLNNIRTVSVPSIGKLPLADKPGTFTPAGLKRDHKGGRLPEDGGYMETSTPARLELSINLQAGISPDSINAIAGEDVIVRLADGSTYLMAAAFVTDPVAIGDGESKVTLVANTSELI